MHQKEEFVLPVLLCNQRSLSKKKTSSASNIQKQAVKIIVLKMYFACVLKNALTFYFSPYNFFPNQMFQFLNTEAVLWINGNYFLKADKRDFWPRIYVIYNEYFMLIKKPFESISIVGVAG